MSKTYNNSGDFCEIINEELFLNNYLIYDKCGNFTNPIFQNILSSKELSKEEMVKNLLNFLDILKSSS